MPRPFFSTAGSSIVPGSTSSSWVKLGSEGADDVYYHAGTKTYALFNPTSGSSLSLPPGDAGRARLSSKFARGVTDADGRAAARSPTTPRAGAGGAGASSIPVIPVGSSGSGSGGASGSPRNFGARYSYYPEDLANTKQDRIKFEMFTVSPRVGAGAGSGSAAGFSSIDRSLGSSAGLTGFGARPRGSSLGTVFLGIQGQISDSNSVDWSGSTINPLQAALARESITTMKDQRSFTGQGVAGMLTGLMGNIFNIAKEQMNDRNVGNNIQILLAQEAVQAQGLLSRLGGQVANPNLELLFNGPQLRPFTFNFRMTPRSTNEAKRVKKIIRFFKEGMAVQTTDSDIFLKSPNIFKIQFQSGESGNAHTSLPRIKDCALIRCDVNYTPDGSYMTFADRTEGYPMTCYELSLAFSEIDPIVGDNYSTSSGVSPDEIGY